MIITDHQRAKRKSVTLLLLSILGGSCLLLLAIAFWPEPSPYQSLPADSVYCGAERVRGGDFISKGVRFGGGQTQSSTHARSGKYSSYLPAASEPQYGMTYTLEQPVPGQAYLASVWRRKQTNNMPGASLAVKVEGPQERYWQENLAVTSDGQGWEKLQLRFSVPFGDDSERFSVYVYSNGQEAAWFDDLLIEPLPADSSFMPQRLALNIPPNHMQKLERKRQQAIEAGILEGGGWVGAQLGLPGQTEPVEADIRLKGDWLDHLAADKWSFRVKLKGGGAWQGMRVFSLHSPAARYYLHEWLAHQLWAREDILATRYDFVELVLNGKSLGIYAYEEHFEKQLPESSQKREGPIMKFSEDGFWASIKQQLGAHGYVRPGSDYGAARPESADIQAFDDKASEDAPNLAQQIEQARHLMAQYRQGERKASEVFDLARMAKYLAICDLLRAYHGIVWHNQRFYYNPITALLEPIGFDAYGDKPQPQYELLGSGALHPHSRVSGRLVASLFMDAEFVAAYHRALHELGSLAYLEAAFDSLASGWSARLEYLQREFPSYQASLDEMLREAQYARSLLLPVAPYSLTAYSTTKRGGKQHLQLANRHHLPLEIVGYGLNGRSMSKALPTPSLLPAQPPRTYLMRLRRDSALRQPGFLDEQAMLEQAPPEHYPLEIDAAARHLFFRLPGVDSLFSTPLLPYPAPGQATDMQRLRQLARLPKSGTSYQVDSARVVFGPGKHELSQSLIVPPGRIVVFEAGAELRLSKGASLIAFCPVMAYGTEESPVKISSPMRDGGGIAVLQAAGLSQLHYLIAEGLNAPAYGAWQLTGAVTFYEAEVRMANCAIIKAQSEDALNTIRTEFELRRCYIGDAVSDGFDADFCKGSIHDSRFERSGNDALDFSGSTITVRNAYINGCGDKGISVGEQSDVSVFDTQVQNAPIGVASKDLSVLRVRGLSLKDCGQGFAAYQKKPEFGPATIIVESYTASGLTRLVSVSEKSSVQGL